MCAYALSSKLETVQARESTFPLYHFQPLIKCTVRSDQICSRSIYLITHATRRGKAPQAPNTNKILIPDDHFTIEESNKFGKQISLVIGR